MLEFKTNTFSNVDISREKNKSKNFENTYQSQLSSHNNYHTYYIYFVFKINQFSLLSDLHTKIHNTDKIVSFYFHKTTILSGKETDIPKFLLLEPVKARPFAFYTKLQQINLILQISVKYLDHKIYKFACG